MWNDWKVYERGGAIFSALEPHTDWFKRRAKGREFYYVDRAFFGFKGDHLYWCYGQPGYRENSIKWIKRWIKEGANGSFVKIAKARYRACMKYLVPLIDIPTQRTSAALLMRFNTIHRYLLLHTRTAGISIDAFDDYFPEVFGEALKKAGFAHVMQDKEVWAVLQQAAYRSVVMDYKLAMIDLALSLRPRAMSMAGSNLQDRHGVRPRDDGPEVERIWKKHFWLTMGWSGTTPITKRDIFKELQQYMKLKPFTYRKERQELIGYAQRIEQARAKVIKKFKIPRRVIQPYLDFLDAVAQLHDERKEIQMRTMHAMDQVRAAAAKQARRPLGDIQWLTVEETRDLLKGGKFSVTKVAKRRKGYCAKFSRGRLVFEKAGATALRAIAQECAVTKGFKEQVRGIAASRGHCIGRALVLDDPKEANRSIRQGDILITSMTTPDFVPAMKKAGAVVTNEGGVTAHAAIVSRELGIPCITGTLHATHIFKTGDRVEVDAEKGIVRKVK